MIDMLNPQWKKVELMSYVCVATKLNRKNDKIIYVVHVMVWRGRLSVVHKV